MPSTCIASSMLVFPLPFEPKKTFTFCKCCRLTCCRFLTWFICNWVSATLLLETRAQGPNLLGLLL